MSSFLHSKVCASDEVMNTFAQQEYIELIKCDSKDIYNVLNSRVVSKLCSFELSIHKRILKKMHQNVH